MFVPLLGIAHLQEVRCFSWDAVPGKVLFLSSFFVRCSFSFSLSRLFFQLLDCCYCLEVFLFFSGFIFLLSLVVWIMRTCMEYMCKCIIYIILIYIYIFLFLYFFFFRLSSFRWLVCSVLFFFSRSFRLVQAYGPKFSKHPIFSPVFGDTWDPEIWRTCSMNPCHPLPFCFFSAIWYIFFWYFFRMFYDLKYPKLSTKKWSKCNRQRLGRDSWNNVCKTISIYLGVRRHLEFCAEKHVRFT